MKEKSPEGQYEIIVNRAKDLMHGIGHPFMRIPSREYRHIEQEGENNVNKFSEFIFNGADMNTIFDPTNYENIKPR